VAVIAATGGTVLAMATKAVTSTIPIIFNIGIDPVQLGLVNSFNRPGGTATGVVGLENLLGGKQLGLLREIKPDVSANRCARQPY
jgi:putative ABC transport system substrate-binding protein